MGEIAPASPTLWIKARLNLGWDCEGERRCGGGSLRLPQAARPAQVPGRAPRIKRGKEIKAERHECVRLRLPRAGWWLHRIDRDIAL